MAVDAGRVKAVVEGPERIAVRSIAFPDIGARTLSYLAWGAIFGAIVGFNEVAIEMFRAGDAVILGRENGPLENVQLVAMVPTLALFFRAGLKARGAVSVAAVALAMVATLAFVREIDFKSMIGSYAWFDWLVVHGLKDAILGLLGLISVLYLFVQRRYFWPVVRLAARWQAWPCVGAFVLLATAEFYLDGNKGLTGHFWEELVETNGYFLLAVAAWRHSILIGDPDLDRPL